MTNLELNDHAKAALTAVLRATIAAIGSFVLVVAATAAESAHTAGAPIVSRPSSVAVSPNLSDVPRASLSQSEKPKVVPAPRPLPPRKTGVRSSR
jgi:hypothetical protein